MFQKRINNDFYAVYITLHTPIFEPGITHPVSIRLCFLIYSFIDLVKI